jgi:hypothetical protein
VVGGAEIRRFWKKDKKNFAENAFFFRGLNFAALER